MEEEEWREIPDTVGGFYVSNLGRVKLDTGEITTGKQNPRGYMRVTIKTAQGSKSVRVHRLVAKAFIPNPDNKPQVHHIDHLRDNNAVENLAWATWEEQRDEHWYQEQKSYKEHLASGIPYTPKYPRPKTVHKRNPKPRLFKHQGAFVLGGTEYRSIAEASKQNNLNAKELRYAWETGEDYYKGFSLGW